jgi:Domain of unknown function (DUF6916)
MRDLSSPTAADFEPAVGTVFEIVDGDADPVKLRLSEVVLLSERPGHRRPFSLRFHGPLSPAREQITHHILDAEMGEFELFLGPIAADGEHITYEAVFA